jgi:recombination protein RecT
VSNTSLATKDANPVAAFSRFMDKLKPQMALALPKHLTADRMTRLALTAFSTTPKLQACSANSIAGAIMTAAQLGLEPGVNGQGFLVPYGATCTFVPGWKGLVDIANRSGRCAVWTGAVFQGDEFDYNLGDNPFIRHKPGEEDEPDKLLYVYAVGRVRDSQYPVIEVWPMGKIWKHRNKYNKVGNKHYSFRDPEMYARKVPLLQVLKYMPSSIELSNAIAATHAAEEGRSTIIVDNIVTLNTAEPEGDETHDLPECTPESFAANKASWQAVLSKGTKTVNDLIAFIETTERLTDDQKMEIAGWATETQGAPA